MAKVFILLSALLAMGCADQVTHQTPSGKPEVTIAGRVGDQARALIAGRMVDAGYNMRSGSDSMLVFDKPNSTVMAAVLFGSRYAGTPNARITYTVIEAGAVTRVVASLAMITNPGSAFERASPMDASPDSQGVQNLLFEIKRTLEVQQPTASAATSPPRQATQTGTAVQNVPRDATLGKQQYSAGEAASAAGCATPELASSQYGVEFYRVGCSDGSRMVRCEWQNCTVVE